MDNVKKGKIIFCTGGQRSGKSKYALSLFEAEWVAEGVRKVFIATAEACDEQMRQRILAHKLERGSGWNTLEIPVNLSLDLPKFVQKAVSLGEALVLDCLSTWVSGCMEVLSVDAQDEAAAIKQVLNIFNEALQILHTARVRAALVSAETGLGLHPLTAQGRLFVDMLGKVNQLAAANSDEAYFLVSGLPLRIK